MELFFGLVSVIVGVVCRYYFDKIEAGKIPPILVGVFCFVFGSFLILSGIKSEVDVKKLWAICTGIHLTFISVIYITIYKNKYNVDALVWISGSTLLIFITGIFLLATDYSNTKILFNSIIIGSVSSFLYAKAKQRLTKDIRKNESIN